MTIKDIAKECGVSITTVSRALNNSGYVKSATRERILSTVGRHGFVLNRNAHELKSRNKSVIAIILCDSANVFLLGVLSRLKSLIESNAYDTNIVIIKETDDEAAVAWNILRRTEPLGFIFLSLNVGNFEDTFWKAEAPCVLITAKIPQPAENILWVSTDDFGAALFMTRHLIERGHRNIGMIGGEDKFSAASRYAGFTKGLEQAGLAFDRDTMYSAADFTFEGGARAAKALMTNRPDLTAIFCISDVMAIGACRALCDMGLRVPDDVSVTGFDAIDAAEFYCPRITTIRQSTERLAGEGFNALKALIDGKGGARGITVPYEFIEGESVKAPRAAQG